MFINNNKTFQLRPPSSPCPSPSYSTYSNFSTISTHSTYSNMNMFNPMFNNNNNNNNNQQLFFFPQETSLIPNYIQSQEENELNRFKMMSIDNIVDLTRENTSDTAANINLMATSTFKGVCSVAQNFDICRGVAYLHECKILHHDIQSTNILVNRDSDMLVSIRKRVSERYSLPFSNDVPIEWRFIVARAMEYEPSWRLNISDICRDFYNLSKKYQQKSLSYDSSMFNFEFNESGCFDEPIIIDDDDDSPSNQNQNIITITILSVDDAIREHKSKND
ncbi:unnamed protein product [Rhizophagus irregularis]|nr:unnamed protein product [Rhizophagus irregularis]